MQCSFCCSFPFHPRVVSVNDTEPAQRGGVIYRGEIASGLSLCSLSSYTQHDTSRVCVSSLARRFPEHENPYGPIDHCVLCRCSYSRDGRIDDFVGAGGVAFPDPDPIGPSLDANKVGGGSPLAPG